MDYEFEISKGHLNTYTIFSMRNVRINTLDTTEYVSCVNPFRLFGLTKVTIF